MTPINDPRIQAILREARRQFVTEGYAGTRIEPIARDASVSTATLYSFFESKSVLFEAVFQDVSLEFSKKFANTNLRPPYNKDSLTHCLVTYAEALSDPFVRKMYRLMISERPRFTEKATNFFDEGRGNIAYTLIDMLEQMQACGQIKLDQASWAVSQVLGMIEYPLLLLPIAAGRDSALTRTAKVVAIDAVETFWARYGVKDNSRIEALPDPAITRSADKLHSVM